MYNLKDYFNPFYIIPWDKASIYIAENARKGDLLICSDHSLDYYLARAGKKALPAIITTEDLKEHLKKGNYSRFWIAVLGRDSGQNPKGDEEWVSSLKQEHKLILEKAYVPLDKSYIEFKERLRQGPSYRNKLTLYLLR